MEDRDNLLAEITKEALYRLCDFSDAQLQDILDHMKNPGNWMRTDGLNALVSERDNLKEALRGTCAVCGHPEIYYDPIMGVERCPHLDTTRIVGFRRRTATFPARCAHWCIREVQYERGCDGLV